MRAPIALSAVLAVISANLLATGCGGSDPGGSQVPVTVAVASVALTPPTASLSVAESVQLTATVKDSAGNALSGRTINWTAGPSGIVTVGSTGLVTAVAPGTATVTATSEGKSGTATITVGGTSVVGTNGGEVSGAGGAIVLHFPAGAVSSNTNITISQAQTAPTPPDGNVLVGSGYILGPAGTTFGAPVTVTLHYDPGTVPLWVMTGDLGLHRLDDGQWQPLSNITLDTTAHTISGQTNGFSTVAIGAAIPHVALSPAVQSVNQQQRSAAFAAVISPHGDAMFVDYSGTFSYHWSTTGHIGTIGAADGKTVQYVAGTPVLPRGVLDTVTVQIFARSSTTLQPVLIGTASGIVNGDLNLTAALVPDDVTIQAGGSVDLQLVVSDPVGPVTPANDWVYQWTSTANNGSIVPSGAPAVPETARTVTYRALTPTVFPPPRTDRIDVVVKRLITFDTRDHAGNFAEDTLRTPFDTARAFVTVKDPPYTAVLSPTGPTIAEGTSVDLHVTLQPSYPDYATGNGLTYRYTTTGTVGSLSSGGTPSASPTVTYTAQSGVSGSDQVHVEVFNKALESIGTATANVVVQRPPQMKDGSIGIDVQTMPSDFGTIACYSIDAVVPSVAGATSYEIAISNYHGFRIPAGNLHQTLSAPFHAYTLCNTRTGSGNFSGTLGSNFREVLAVVDFFVTSPGDQQTYLNQLLADVAGAQVKVTIKF